MWFGYMNVNQYQNIFSIFLQPHLLYPHHKMWGGLYWIRFVASVGRSVCPSPILVRSITPLRMEGFPSNLNDTFTSTRGCAEPMLPMCQLKVKVTVKCQILNNQKLDFMSCPLCKPYTNGRISLDVQSLCCPCVSSRSRSQLKVKY